MDIKDSYLHGTVGVVKSINVDADKLKYTLADIAGTVREVTLPVATTSANGLMSSGDKTKLDNLSSTIGNYVTLNTDQEITGIKTFTKQLKFTVAKGTAPFLVTSDTKVTNLNADYLDGTHKTELFTEFLNINNTDNPRSVKLLIGDTTKYLLINHANNARQLAGLYAGDVGDANEWYHTNTSVLKFRTAISNNILNIPDANSWQNSLLEIGLHSNGSTAQLYFSKDRPLYYRSNYTNEWKEIAFTDSNITGNAATATHALTADKLKTKRKLWGLDFDGTADVSGDMTGVGNINSIINVETLDTLAKLNIKSVGVQNGVNYLHLYVSSNNTSNNKTRPLVLQNDYGNVGIGIAQPSEKLEVNGNVKATSFLGNLDGTYVNKLTGYTKATTASDLSTDDTLNTALGKLEYKADTAYDWIISVTAEDTDKYVNKWLEILDFLDLVEEGKDITDEFVTRKTDLEITGVKTFKNGIGSANTQLKNGSIINSFAFPEKWSRYIKFNNKSGNTTVSAAFGVLGEGSDDNGTKSNHIDYLYLAHQNLDYITAVFKVYSDKATISGNEIYHKGNIKEKLTDVNEAVPWKFFHSILDATNIPSGARDYISGFTIATNNNLDYRILLAFDIDGKIFSRSEYRKVWSEWKTVAFTDSDITGSSASVRVQYNSTSISSGVWNTFKTRSNPLTVNFYDVYNDGGPTTYGNMLEIVGNTNHWQPLLWFGSYKGGSLYHRNKDYNTDEWGSWYKILDTNNYYSHALSLSGGIMSGGVEFANSSKDTWNFIQVLSHNDTAPGYRALRFNNSGENKAVIHWFYNKFSGYETALNTINIQAKDGLVTLGNWTNPGLTVTHDSKVGIGTTAPEYKLDVNGTLRANTVTISNTTSAISLLFSRPGYNYITAPTKGVFAFTISDDNSNLADKASLVIADTLLRAGTTNTVSLGVSGFRWSNVYSVQGDFTGNVTIRGDYQNTLDIVRSTSEIGSSVIKFSNKAGTLGYLGVSSSGSSVGAGHPIFTDANNATYKIWHSDNDGPNSGLDADMLDGLHASDLLKGLFLIQKPITVSEAGWYTIASATLYFRGLSEFTICCDGGILPINLNIEVFKGWSGSNSWIKCYGNSDKILEVRLYYEAETYRIDIYCSSALSNYQLFVKYPTASSGFYNNHWKWNYGELPKSTLSGDLWKSLSISTKFHTALTGDIHAANGFLLSTCNGHTLTIGSENLSYCHFKTSANNIYFNKSLHVAGSILPYITNNYHLGDSTYRWGHIYSVNGNFTGDVTLYNGNEGDSPRLIFLRYKLDQSYNIDWCIYDTGGNLTFLKAAGSGWQTVFTIGYLNDDTTVVGNSIANGFVKKGSSDSYVLLGGGGHKAVSDFASKTSFTVTIPKANLYVRACSLTTSDSSTGSSAIINIRTHYASTVTNVTFLVTGTFNAHLGITEISNPHLTPITLRIGSNSTYCNPLNIDILTKSEYTSNSTYYVLVIPLHDKCYVTVDGTAEVAACTYSKELTSHTNGAITTNSLYSNALRVNGDIKIKDSVSITASDDYPDKYARGYLWKYQSNKIAGLYLIATQNNVERLTLGLGDYVNAVSYGLSIIPNGNVGIGTDLPSEKLHVKGNVKANIGHFGYVSPGQFNDGIRLYGKTKSGSWSNINFGCDPSAENYTHDDLWMIGRNTSNLFMIGCGGNYSINQIVISKAGAMTTKNSITATKFVTSGGTSSLFVKGDGSLDSNTYATTNNTFTKFSYTLPANKKVRITYSVDSLNTISVCGSNKEALLVLMGTGYGHDGTTRNTWTEVVSCSTNNFTWCIGLDNTCVEISSSRVSDSTIIVLSSGDIMFTEIDSLSLAAMNRTLLHSKNYTDYTVKKDGTGATGTWDINVSKLLGYTAGYLNGLIALFADFPNFNTLMDLGYLSSDYESNNHPTEEYLKAVCKWAIHTKYGLSNITLIGRGIPSSLGTIILHLYSHMTAHDTTKLPRYCGGLYIHGHNHDLLVVHFGTTDYIWHYNQINANKANILKEKVNYTCKNVSLSNAQWIDTNYKFTDLESGTYAIQVTSDNLVASGIMSVYKNLEDSVGDEIPLHVYGTAGWRPYLRTYQNKLLISSNDTSSTSRTVTIKIALIL